VQDEITASVSAAILPTMERSERQRAARKPPDSLDAWECYHRGMWHYAKIEAGENALAQDFFERAIALDPGFAAARAALGVAILTDARLFYPTDKQQGLIARAVEHSRRSIALDPTEVVGHTTLATALLLMSRHNEAITEADLAASLDPNSALAHASQGMTRTFGGRPGGGYRTAQNCDEA
jgi:tetratricopeptide (TPR) repeat protein